MDNPFWADGPKAYGKELREQFEKRLSDLENRLNESKDETERSQIHNEITQARDELNSKLKSIDESLF